MPIRFKNTHGTRHDPRRRASKRAGNPGVRRAAMMFGPRCLKQGSRGLTFAEKALVANSAAIKRYYGEGRLHAQLLPHSTEYEIEFYKELVDPMPVTPAEAPPEPVVEPVVEPVIEQEEPAPAEPVAADEPVADEPVVEEPTPAEPAAKEETPEEAPVVEPVEEAPKPAPVKKAVAKKAVAKKAPRRATTRKVPRTTTKKA